MGPFPAPDFKESSVCSMDIGDILLRTIVRHCRFLNASSIPTRVLASSSLVKFEKPNRCFLLFRHVAFSNSRTMSISSVQLRYKAL
ncbi:hypothetical protein MPTK1_6g14560 [Marchantia polymorpha subsp. ruderalis]|uniref:Uncharacterized protein n=2 Tax=Marchantia polymorpha TaxID=3197 RepID=A0AAF6BS10_MARPO|nr:hypothetical protein MARPO_0047s0112 [Marchantia polymorpha]BBN14794.1 hypothetical protein Mp_6g14560 [Marchantia polymorpha subsp. ruderalis]|eukprot:PTQ39140.1 hypothetical protein MARPO_0047s0112 [Marchantia polymorpha]